jgi:hypothetical protein
VYPTNRFWKKARVVPFAFGGLSIWDFRKGHKCGLRSSFWSRVLGTSEVDCPAFMLLLGGRDCEHGNPEMVLKGRCESVLEAIEIRVDLYFGLIRKLIRRLPGRSFLVHPVISREETVAPIVFEFNAMLKQRCLEDKQQLPELMFMDVFPKQDIMDTYVNGTDLRVYDEWISTYMKGSVWG